MENKVNLFVINTNYPFGKTETFLENEILFIEQYFDKVYLFPLNYPSKDFFIRRVPDNVIYFEPSLDKYHSRRIIKFIFKYSPIRIHLLDLKNIFLNPGGNITRRLKSWFISLMIHRAFYKSKPYRFIINNLKPKDVLYFYWGGSKSIFASSFNHPKTFIRIHGGEIDLQRSKGYIPLFNRLLRPSATYLAISNKVRSEALKINRNCNIVLNRLGTFDHGIGPVPDKDSIIRIVSCSNVIPLKRVHLILKAIKSITSLELEWVHFGDGPGLRPIMDSATRLPTNIKYTFKGRVLNSEILDYYKNNHISLFINISTTEGVPVSIMEALSFGIPCFATDVGGTSELVNNSNGLLVSKDFEIPQLTDCITNCNSIEFQKKRKSARKTWESHCNAESNYLKLVELMLS